MDKRLLLLVCATSMAGCATHTVGPQRPYTKQELGKMTLCIGMSDTAMYVATSKLKGVPAQTIRDFYRPKPYSKLNLATVDRVYAAEFSSAWDYTVSFFNECAQNMADVPPSRVSIAAYCMQRGLIADFAYSFRSAGAAREHAYAYFSKFPRKTTHEVIDQVYSSSLSRADTKLDAWNTCMAAVSANE